MTTSIPFNVSISNDKVTVCTYLFINALAALTTAWFFTQRSEFGREQFFNLPVRHVRVEKTDKLFRGLPSIHVQGEYAAVVAAESAGQSLQLYRVETQTVQLRRKNACMSGTRGEIP